jgi:ABC-type transport system involved in multi-copper enzyme maturation permease subunit
MSVGGGHEAAAHVPPTALAAGTPVPLPNPEGPGANRGSGRSWLARALVAVSPGAIPGPVFEKEIRVSGRRAGVYWIRGLCALLLFSISALVYVTVFSVSDTDSAASLQQLQTIAPALVIAIIWFQFIALTLVATASASPMICDEKRSGTLAALLTTPLTAIQILMGKVAAMLANLLVLGLIPLPLLLAARIFGGTPVSVIVASSSLTLASALLGAMIGLHASACSARASTAAVRALVTWGILQFGPALAIWALVDGANLSISPEWIARSSAVMGLFAAQWILYGGIGPFANLAHELWIIATVVTLVQATVFFLLGVRRLRRVMSEDGSAAAPAKKGAHRRTPHPLPGESGTAAPTTAPIMQSAAATAMPGTPRPPALPVLPQSSAVDGEIVTRSGSREVSDQPVAWRELRQPMFKSTSVMLVVMVVLPLIALVAAAFKGVDGIGYLFTGSLVAALYVLCAGCLSTASGLSGERESRTLDVLLASPLSAREIVAGKVLGTLRRSLAVPLMVSVVLGLMGPLSFEWSPVAGLHLFLILVSMVVATAGSGIVLSLICKRTAVAMAMNLGLWLAVWGAIPIMLAILLAISDGRATESIASLIGLTNPFAMITVSGAGAREWNTSSGYLVDETYDLFSFGALDVMGYTLVVLVFAAFYVGVGVFLMAVASTILAERTGRRR